MLLNSTEPGAIVGSVTVTLEFIEPETDQFPFTFSLNPFVLSPFEIK